MKARDIMTKTVVSIRPETPVREVAALMTEKRVSGVPVVADGKVLGIVSQGDLLHRQKLGTEAKHRWWLRVFSDPDRLATEYTKSHGLKAADIMARKVISVSEDTELTDVAATLDRNGIKRVPVLCDGKIVGLITRSDLVKALSQAPSRAHAMTVDNGTLQRTLSDKMKAQDWLSATYLNTVVTDGRVELWGHIDTAAQHRALHVLVEDTAGVTAVEDHLIVGRLPISAI
jgi:CBS domain-containing protein